jgi:hypothetical protein
MNYLGGGFQEYVTAIFIFIFICNCVEQINLGKVKVSP